MVGTPKPGRTSYCKAWDFVNGVPAPPRRVIVLEALSRVKWRSIEEIAEIARTHRPNVQHQIEKMRGRHELKFIRRRRDRSRWKFSDGPRPYEYKLDDTRSLEELIVRVKKNKKGNACRGRS